MRPLPATMPLCRKLCRAFTRQSSVPRVPVKGGEAVAGGVVVDGRRFERGGGTEFEAVVREAVAAEQDVVEHADEAPVRGSGRVPLRAELDLLADRSGAGVERVAFAADGDIDGVGGGDVIAAAAIRSGDVLLIVGRAQRRVRVGLVVIDPERAEIAEVVFPQHAAGVHIARADAVHALDEKASADDLLGRSVAVARQHVEVRAAAKPQDAERRLHETVVGFHGVADVAILMRPVGRTRQRSFADDEEVIFRRRSVACSSAVFLTSSGNSGSADGRHSTPPYGRTP